MTASLRARRRVRLDQVGLFADGTAVKQVGVETFRLCRTLIDAHGGKLWAEQNATRGATFHVSLAQAKAAPAQAT